MKRYTAVLVDKLSSITENPNHTINNFESISYNVNRLHNELRVLFNITKTRYRFGYMHDELHDGYRKSLGNISHVVTSVWEENNKIYCNIMVLDTHQGNLLQSLMDGGMKFSLVYNFSNNGYETIDVKSVWDENKCPEKYILKSLDTKENFK